MNEEVLHNSFHEASIFPKPKLPKTSPQKESWSVFLRNRDAKILNKILANWIQQHIKWYNQVEFIPEIQVWFNIWKSISVISHNSRIKQGSTNFVWGHIGKIFRLCWPCSLCHNCSTLSVFYKSSHRQCINKWAWLCSS